MCYDVYVFIAYNSIHLVIAYSNIASLNFVNVKLILFSYYIL